MTWGAGEFVQTKFEKAKCEQHTDGQQTDRVDHLAAHSNFVDLGSFV